MRSRPPELANQREEESMPAKGQSERSTADGDDDIARLSAEIAEIRELLAALAGDRETGSASGSGSSGGETNDHHHPFSDTAYRAAHQIADAVTEFAEKRPLHAAFVAFIIGALIGSRGRR